MTDDQRCCDWCYGPISDGDRRRSHDLGLDAERSLGCHRCVDSGRIGHPPEAWAGDPRTWPIAMGWQDISREQREREARQLTLMRDGLRRFQAGNEHVGGLINDLEGLLDNLELTSAEWTTTVQSKCGALEVRYAVALHDGVGIPDNSDPRVGSTVEALLALVEDRLWVVS